MVKNQLNTSTVLKLGIKINCFFKENRDSFLFLKDEILMRKGELCSYVNLHPTAFKKPSGVIEKSVKNRKLLS